MINNEIISVNQSILCRASIARREGAGGQVLKTVGVCSVQSVLGCLVVVDVLYCMGIQRVIKPTK